MAIDDPDEQGGDGEDPGEADEASSTSDGDAVGEEPDPGDVADKLKEAVRSGASLNDAMTDTTADDDAYAVGQSVGEKGGLSTDDSDDAPTRSGAPDGTEEAGEVWGEDQSSRAATDNEREPGEADGVNESPLVEGSSLELDRENVDQSAAQDRQITDVRGPPGGTEEAVPEPVEFTPATVRDHLGAGATIAKTVHAATAATASGPPMVAKDEYTWAHFKVEYYYDEDGNPPRDDEDEVIPFDPSSYLRFDPSLVRSFCAHAGKIGDELGTVVDERTLDVPEDLDEDAFFSTVEGHTTIVNRYDLERAVDIPKKGYFREVERYWVNKPFAFVVIYHSEKENEKKYYLIEPYATPVEEDL
ncbi:MAG: hypothetical protein ABEJ27_03985, partial [Halodesulfurarchaeum sp.]